MIVITHAHIDHIGGAEKLRALTGAPVYMHEADKMLSDQLAMQAAWLGIETPKDPGIDTAGPRRRYHSRGIDRSARFAHAGSHARQYFAVSSA